MMILDSRLIIGQLIGMNQMTKKVGITGQGGFIGRHTYNYLNLQDDIELVEYQRSFFEDAGALEKFVSDCDIIIHLAAMNRHGEPQVIYDTNVGLVNQLIAACEKTDSAPWIIISSSTQEERDNLYGASKKKSRILLEEWAARSGGKTTGMVIPNVFGPFGKPLYNSVFATFCHKIVNGEEPTIINDGHLKLVYVNELVDDIYQVIRNEKVGKVTVAHRHEMKVSEMLDLLRHFYSSYFEQGKFPNLNSPTELAMFNSFRCYIPHDYYPRKFTKHTDNRGSFVEIVRADTSGQFSFSTTVPGITRGNHFHTRKAERFAVIKGKASIQLRKVDTDEVIEYIIDGEEPAYVDMPIWHTHNISNIGDEELITLFWINEPYDPADADTYFINV